MTAAVRLAVHITGIVQGVGFRPFVYRIARERGLVGWVRNGADGVRLEVQGARAAVDSFLVALRLDAPPRAVIERVATEPVPAGDESEFHIEASQDGGPARPAIGPDLAVCPDCLAEIAAPDARRYRYPFTNCTQCGPRFTIVTGLPYDRPLTAMAGFALCADCEAEYHDPGDRRFHAQPIACPRCGPRLALSRPDGLVMATGDEALAEAVAAIQAGRIVALKGLGGYQLLVDASDAAAVSRLRERKHRPEKPFAVMFPDLDALARCCEVSPAERAVLASPAAPILLVRRTGGGVCEGVAPGNPRLGAMLPNTPLHQLVLAGVGRPVVCTSGNLTDEPICTDDAEALAGLQDVADVFLSHDRPVVRPMDDSVARVDGARLRLLRRARGFAPAPLPAGDGPVVLALGGHQKVTVALRTADQVVVGQHLGDMVSQRGVMLLERMARELLALHGARPAAIACDCHPDYASTRVGEKLAAELGVPLVQVQHHHAHVAAVMAEHGLAGEVLGLAWDGTGYGSGGMIWGGEAIATDGAHWSRVAHLRPFRLPGGDQAAHDPRRSALGVLFELFGSEATEPAAALYAPAELAIMLRALARGVNAPRTSSLGRLFDAVAALTGLRTARGFEGQAAMTLEFAAERVLAEARQHRPYPLPLAEGAPAVADWAPLVRALLDDVARGVPPGVASLRFHQALAALAVAIARRVGLPRIVLSGGCFQNALLSALVRAQLEAAGFSVYEAERYPPNDGGLSLGQVHVAAARLALVPAREVSPCV